MKRKLLLVLLLQMVCSLTWAQHYQRFVNDVISCQSYSCIQTLLNKTGALNKDKPQAVIKDFGLDAQRVLLDFEYPYKAGNETKKKIYRLSLFVHRDSLYFGQLDQMEGTRLETSYLFRNKVDGLENHVSEYNSAKNTRHTYKDLINTIISRDPTFWMW